jgi:hypothetical protein
MYLCLYHLFLHFLSQAIYITPIVSTQFHTIYMLAGWLASEVYIIYTFARRLYYRRHPCATIGRLAVLDCSTFVLGKRNMAITFANYQNVDDDESPHHRTEDLGVQIR